jgi:hypothetical protein
MSSAEFPSQTLRTCTIFTHTTKGNNLDCICRSAFCVSSNPVTPSVSSQILSLTHLPLVSCLPMCMHVCVCFGRVCGYQVAYHSVKICNLDTMTYHVKICNLGTMSVAYHVKTCNLDTMQPRHNENTIPLL